MNRANSFSQFLPWLKPVFTCLLGLALLFRPDSLTSVLGSVIGFVVSLIGAGLMIGFFFGNTRKYINLISGIILLILGFSIVKSPMSLVSQFGRLIGVLLLLQSFREGSDFGAGWNWSRVPSALTAVVGVILMLAPVSASRLLISGCGIAILVFGAAMLRNTYRSQQAAAAQKPDIIDV